MANNSIAFGHSITGVALVNMLTGGFILVSGKGKFNKFTFGYTRLNLLLLLPVAEGHGFQVKRLQKHC